MILTVQKIQEAVETLRDPVKRQKLDDQLVDQCLRLPQIYTGWRPASSYGYASRYMYAYGNSVHMDPDSKDSREERAHWNMCDPQRKEWSERVKVMQEHMNRETQSYEFDQAHQAHQVHPAKVDPSPRPFTAAEKALLREFARSDLKEDHINEKEEVKDAQIPDYEGPFYSDYSGSVGPSGTEYETACQSDTEGLADDSFISDDDTSSWPGDIDLRGEDDTMATTGSTVFYEADTTQATTSTSTASQADTDTETQTQTKTGHHAEHPEQLTSNLGLDPLAPFFDAKVHDRLHNYTETGLKAELRGIVLEASSNWQEAVRASSPDAEPVTTNNDPTTCAHMGHWVKEYLRASCGACGFWKPIFVLTCPSCGVEKCVVCKFADSAVPDVD